MRVPQYLYQNFEKNFENHLFTFLEEKKLLNRLDLSERFLNRNLTPHIKNLSQLFNRKNTEDSIDATYWKKTSNPKNLQLAYFLYFMPFNFFRMAAALGELNQLGFDWNSNFNKNELKIIEFGAGPASGLSGFLFALKSLFQPKSEFIECALIDQNKSIGEMGAHWLNSFAQQNDININTRFFHRKIELNRPLLPYKSPKFDIWLMSYFLNEYSESLDVFTPHFLKSIDTHLEDKGLVFIIEPALKEESRKLLSWRKNLISSIKNQSLKILLPCLGEQSCGALEKPGDWCHEDILFFRPKYIETLDRSCDLNHRTLPFSYLILMKTDKKMSEIFPSFSNEKNLIHRLVSPSHFSGRDLEFYLCGSKGKHKTRLRTTPHSAEEKTTIRQSGGKVENEINRGDVIETKFTSDADSSIQRIQQYKKLKSDS